MIAVSCAALTAERLRRRGDRHEAGSDAQARRGRRAAPRRCGPRRPRGRACGRDRICAPIAAGRGNASRQSAGALAKVAPAEPRRPSRRRCRCRRPRPAPQCARPAGADGRACGAAKVTVRVARTAAPRTSPVSPSIPEGMSTARIGRPPRSARSTIAARLAVEIPREPRSEERVDDERRPRRPDSRGGDGPGRSSRGGEGRVALQRAPAAEQREATSWPRSARRRAATKPSPPLLPGPQRTRMPPGPGADLGAALRRPPRRPVPSAR